MAVIGALALAACASKGRNAGARTANTKMFAVISASTSFYRYGPQQGNGPDQSLPKDTLMTLIRPSFGYSKVQLAKGGSEGYVSSEDIKPASPTLLASLNPPAPELHPSSEAENFDIHSSEPPPLESLPAPDLPPTSSEPLPSVDSAPTPTPAP
ncbi:MAG: hypothetical protein ABI946_02220 [Chthoniobacterales bacterium]